MFFSENLGLFYIIRIERILSIKEEYYLSW